MVTQVKVIQQIKKSRVSHIRKKINTTNLDRNPDRPLGQSVLTQNLGPDLIPHPDLDQGINTRDRVLVLTDAVAIEIGAVDLDPIDELEQDLRLGPVLDQEQDLDLVDVHDPLIKTQQAENVAQNHDH